MVELQFITIEQLLAKAMRDAPVLVKNVKDVESAFAQFRSHIDAGVSPGLVIDLAGRLTKNEGLKMTHSSESIEISLIDFKANKNEEPQQYALCSARLVVERIECGEMVEKVRERLKATPALRLYPDPGTMLGPIQHEGFREPVNKAFTKTYKAQNLDTYGDAWYRWRLEKTGAGAPLPAWLAGDSVAEALPEAMGQILEKLKADEARKAAEAAEAAREQAAQTEAARDKQEAAQRLLERKARWKEIQPQTRQFFTTIRRQALGPDRNFVFPNVTWDSEWSFPWGEALVSAMSQMVLTPWETQTDPGRPTEVFRQNLGNLVGKLPGNHTPQPGDAESNLGGTALPPPLIRDVAWELFRSDEPEVWHGCLGYGRPGAVVDKSDSTVVMAVPLVVPDTTLAPERFTILWAWLVVESIPVTGPPSANQKVAAGGDPGMWTGGHVYPAPAIALLDVDEAWRTAVERAAALVKTRMEGEYKARGKNDQIQPWPTDRDFRWSLLTMENESGANTELPCALIGHHLGAAFAVAIGTVAGWSKCQRLFFRGTAILGSLAEEGGFQQPDESIKKVLTTCAESGCLSPVVAEILSGPGFGWGGEFFSSGLVREVVDFDGVLDHLARLGRVVLGQREACSKIEFLGGSLEMEEAYQDVSFLREVTKQALEELEKRKKDEGANEKNGGLGGRSSASDRENREAQNWRAFDKTPYLWADLLANKCDPETNKPFWEGAQQPHFVLLGVPGGGKSTFTRYLAWLGCQPTALNWRSDFNPGHRFALRVSLPNWRKWDNTRRKWDTTSNLFAFLAANDVADHATIKQTHGLDVDEGFWEEVFKQNRIILVLDGLDEVGSGNAGFLTKVFQFVNKRKAQVPLILTCRTLDFEVHRNELQQGWRFFAPEDLKDEMIRKFIGVYPDETNCGPSNWRDRLIQQLGLPDPSQADGDAELEDAPIKQLARIPMMLNVMCYLGSRPRHNSDYDPIPALRAELYSKAVEELLKRKRDRSGVHHLTGLEVDDSSHRAHARRILAAIALDAFLVNRGATGIRTSEIFKKNSVSFSVWEDVKTSVPGVSQSEWLKWLRSYSGLLRELNDAYTFFHKQFLEFLAGEAIAKALAGDTATSLQLHRDLIPTIDDPDAWREVLRYALAVKLGVGDPAQSVRQLEQVDVWLKALVDKDNFKHVPPDQSWKCAMLAGDFLTGLRDDIEGIAYRIDTSTINSVRAALIALIRSNAFLDDKRSKQELMAGTRRRARAGALLAWLGDPRPGVAPGYEDVWKNGPAWFRRFNMKMQDDALPDLLQMQFCFVPREHGATQGTQSGNKQKLSKRTDFWIAQFPITVAQYRLFASEENYKRDNPWWKHVRNDIFNSSKAWKRLNQQIESVDPVQQRLFTPNHPMVCVTFYEAMAFVTWLDQLLSGRKCMDLKDCWRLRLLTPTEWSRAAHGGPFIPRNQSIVIRSLSELAENPYVDSLNLEKNSGVNRFYPWSESSDKVAPAHFTNWNATGINATSAVGCFPHGVSPVGAEELIGNVWEWVIDEGKSGSIVSALRGGSWRNGNPGNLFCGRRNDRAADVKHGNIGFRCGWVRVE